MFFGRENDLSQLERLWRKSVPSLVTCRGRRRIGKSTLIEEFAARSHARLLEIEGLPPQPSQTNQDQLDHFAEQLCEQSDWKGGGFASWYEALLALDQVIGEERTVVLLDEISWMGAHDENFPGVLKTMWDRRLKKHAHLVFVLCGSVSTWIQDNILNSTGFVGRAALNLVVGELPLKDCLKFWGTAAERLSAREILDVLSVTGGVPRYLEEVDPALSAIENIQNMCFSPKALLRDDFSKIFNSVFGANAAVKQRILRTLAQTPLSVSEIASAIGMEKCGAISKHLDQLSVAGFVMAETGHNPLTQKPAKNIRYRIRDNYSRFFLKYIAPNAALIDRDAFTCTALDALPGWDALMGYQFENLVINNLPALLPRLGLGRALLLSAAPYRQQPTARKKGCQIDLLLQTESSVCIVEIKRRKEIGLEVEREIREKVARLAVKRGVSVRTALVYEGNLSPRLEATAYVDHLVDFSSLLFAEG